MSVAEVEVSPQSLHGPLRLRLAEITFEVVSDDAAFLEELEGRYADCATADAGADGAIRCTVRRTGGFLEFEFSGVDDPLDAALTPFRVVRSLRAKLLADCPHPGWRAYARGGDPGDILIAGDRTRILLRLDDFTRERAAECLIAVALRAQPDIMFLHAGSVAIDGRGALLVGPSMGGKSSTVLALAARGHGFLGDDLAAIRWRTGELLPFPKSAGLRAGRIAGQIEARARAFRSIPGTGLDGVPRRYARVADMFPGCSTGPVPLECVFVLDGFAARSEISEYRPSLQDVMRLKSVVSESAAGWGDSAGGDLMRFLRITDLFQRGRCYLLKLGSLDESATLIERAMRNA